MKATFYGNAVKFVREEGDPKFYGTKHAAGEHALFNYIKKWLNSRGFCLIKKRAQKDGHMVGDKYQPYLRTAKAFPAEMCQPHIMIISDFYALRGANEDWNEGEVTLELVADCFRKGQDTKTVLTERCCRCRPEELRMELER